MNRQVDIKALVSHIVRGDGLDKCRICMGDTAQGQVHLTDTVMMDGDKAVTLSELLEIITGVEIEREELCPAGVCAACAAAALAAEEFRILVQSSESTWLRALANLQAARLQCGERARALCAFVAGGDCSVRVCEDYLGGAPDAVVGRGRGGPVARAERRPRGPRAAGPGVSCPDCLKRFASPHLLHLHLLNDDQKDACLSCGLVLPRGAALQRHLASAHAQAALVCPRCPTVHYSREEYRAHRAAAHARGALTCGACGRTFPRRATLEAHVQMHAVRTCRRCGAQFSNRSCYRAHRARCEPAAKPAAASVPRDRRGNLRDPAVYTCDHCAKSYSSRPQLKNHILWIHLDHRPHQCQWCGKRFYTAARLTEHSVVHTRERNFECDVCAARLVSRSALVYHRRRHTGEKPYVCDDCGAAFVSSSRRLEHAKRKHNKGRRFPCARCPAAFVRRMELAKHAERAHPDHPDHPDQPPPDAPPPT